MPTLKGCVCEQRTHVPSHMLTLVHAQNFVSTFNFLFPPGWIILITRMTIVRENKELNKVSVFTWTVLFHPVQQRALTLHPASHCRACNYRTGTTWVKKGYNFGSPAHWAELRNLCVKIYTSPWEVLKGLFDFCFVFSSRILWWEVLNQYARISNNQGFQLDL